MKTNTSLGILVACLFLTFFHAKGQQANQRTNTKNAIPYLEHLPEGYAAEGNNKEYPLLIFLHGAGEKGDGSIQQLQKVAKNGPPKVIANGHDMTFGVDGEQHSLIVISPQLLYSAGSWPDNYVAEIVDYVLEKYRVDKSRIYLTGLSLGGGGTWRFGGLRADLFAAIAPICGAQSVMYDRARKINEHNLPVWAFHGDADRTVPLSSSKGWVNAINGYGIQPESKLTVYSGVGHNSWSRAYSTSHAYHQPNLYEWLLSHKLDKKTTQAPAPAPAPAASNDDCGCDYVVPANKHEINGSSLGIKAGDVICLKAGTNYQNLKFVNLIGSASQPIIIKNCGGQININTSATFAIKVNASKHFRITGSGTSTQYGIVLRGAKSLGLSLGEKSTDFEVDRLEIHTIGFAGIMAKTDPACGKNNDRSKFTMKNIEIHDNYIHDTHGEGIYVGNSFYAKGINTSCGRLFPHAIHNAKIYNNTVKRTGWDGIQIGSATQGCEVYNNTVEEYGKRREPIHGNGIQLGEGTGGKCYNNVIRNGFASGIIVLGKGDNVIFNNLLINNGGHGSFIDARPPATTGKGFKFFNNTIVNPGEDGVRIYATQSGLNNQVKNNIIVGGNTPVKLLHNGVTNTEVDKNFITKTVSQVQFVNHTKGDYRLKSSSPCVDKGADLTNYGVTFDLENVARPAGGAFDIGARELVASTTPASPPSPTPPSTENGLRYSYYEGDWSKVPDFESLVAVQTGTTQDFDISLRQRDQQYGFTFDGFIEIATAGEYTFYTTSDDGSLLYINEQKVVDNNGLHGPRERSGLVVLEEGRHAIKVAFFEQSGGEVLKVSYRGPGLSKTAVPSSVLYLDDANTEEEPTSEEPSSDEEGLISYAYYEGIWNQLPDFQQLTPTTTGWTNDINLEVRERDSKFGVVFRGYIDIPTSGEYTFLLKSDDGSQLYIDGESDSHLVVNNNGLHAATFKEGTTTLEAGVHPIMITFFERDGEELLEVYWKNTAHGVEGRTLVPSEAFVSADAYTALEDDEDENEETVLSAPAVYVNFASGSAQAAAPWNNFAGTKAGAQSGTLRNQQGDQTSLEVTLLDTWGGSKSQHVAGNTVYPKAVVNSYHWDASPHQKRIKITGMQTDATYSITLFASRAGSGNKTTVYSVDNASKSLNAANNLMDTVVISGITSNAKGEAVLRVSRDAGISYTYLNALVIRQNSDQSGQKLSADASKAPALSTQFSYENTTQVYPNPIAGQLTVELLTQESTQTIRVELKDMMGHALETKSVSAVNRNKATVVFNDLDHLKSGIYLLDVFYDNAPGKTVRLIKN